MSWWFNKCCRKGTCDCDCGMCSDARGDGSYRENAPCCWAIEIAGMASLGGGCDCSDLNSSFFVSQTNDGGPCIWHGPIIPATDCGFERSTVQIEIDGAAHYWFVVAIFDASNNLFLFKKDCGTSLPSCCTSHEIPFIAAPSPNPCDSSAVTCTITPVDPGDVPDLCTWYAPDCIYCSDAGKAPAFLYIAIDGMAAGDCRAETCECINGTWMLEQSGACDWRTEVAACPLCDFAQIRAEIGFFDGARKLRVQVVNAGGVALYEWSKTYASNPDCMTWDAEDLPDYTAVSDNCDGTGSVNSGSVPATCTVTSGSGGLASSFPEKVCIECEDCGASKPDRWQIVITGLVDGDCICTPLNSTWIITVSADCACAGKAKIGATVCEVSPADPCLMSANQNLGLSIFRDGDDTRFTVTFYPGRMIWSKTVPFPVDCTEPVTMDVHDGTVMCENPGGPMCDDSNISIVITPL